MREKSSPSATSEAFDRAYRLPITIWGDARIPRELKELVQSGSAHNILELGCGLGRFSRYLAKQKFNVTAVDFSPVAIGKARTRVARDISKPNFIVGDVTNLKVVRGPFDLSFDVGCFHCLDHTAQQKYAAEVHRLLKPGGIHLLWTMDNAPSEIPLNPSVINEIFKNGFKLQNAKLSRRRIVRSHWYWLVRLEN